MPQVIDIPNVGEVEFPDEMSEAEIASAIETDIFPQPKGDSSSMRAELPTPGGQRIGRPSPLDPFTRGMEEQAAARDAGFERARAREASILTPEEQTRLDSGIAANLMHAPPGLSVPMVTGEEVAQTTGLPEGASKVLAGALQTTSQAANFALSPVGLAGAAVAGGAALPGIVGAAGRAALGTFAIDAIKNTPAAVAELGAAIESGDPEAISRTASGLALNVAVGAGAGRGAIAKMPAPVAEVAAKAEVSGLPKAAEALKEVAADRPAEVGLAPEPARAEPSGDFEVPLGLNRPALRDRSMEVLSEQEFDSAYRGAKKKVGELEKILDERDLTRAEQESLGQAQDIFTAASLERFRRNTRDTVPADLFRELKKHTDAARRDPQSEGAARFQIVMEELQRQGASVPELISETSLRSADAAEVFEGQLRDIQEASRSVAGKSFFSEQPLGIVPSGVSKGIGVIDRVTEIFKRHSPETLSVELKSAERLPDFQPREVSQSMASSPRGAGRIPGLGYFFDARTKAQTPQEVAIITRQLEKHTGDAIGNAVELEFGGKIDKAFDVQPDGTVGVIVQGNPARVPISDAFEALQRDPKVFDLTPEQAAAFEQVQTVMAEAEALAARNKVSRFSDNESLMTEAGEGVIEASDSSHPYFPRIRIDVPEGRSRGSAGSAKIGAKPFYDKSRVFETEAAGKAASVNYLPSIERRVGEYVRKTYRKIADRRMAEDASLQGQPKGDVIRFGEAEIEHPAFRGRVYPVQIADVVNNFYRSRDSSFRQAVVSANSVLKQIGFSLDWAAPFLQGQVMMFTHPARWAKAATESIKAFGNKDTLARYAENPENLSAVRELAQLGVKVNELQDFMLAEGAGKKIGNLPGFRHSKQSFETFLGVAQTELWKAYREVTPKEQLPALAETLQNMLSHGRMEEAGLSPGRALLERTLLLAPSYLRGSVGLVSSIAQRGASGSVARRAIGSYVLGGAALYYGLMKSAGKSDEEILERMDPSKSNFMTVPVEFADGRVRNVGFGGAIKSLVRLTASVSDAIINHPERLQPGADDNPMIRWLRGKAAPLPGFATDALLGTDFLGNEITWLDALRARVTPLPVQQIIKRPGEPDATAGDIIPGALGLSVYPENLRNQFAMERNAAAKKEFGKDFESLGVADQLKVTKEVEKKPIFAVKEPTSKRMIERAFQADVDRRERLVKKLSPETQEAVGALNIIVPGYDAKLSLGNKEIQLTLTKKQQERYEEIIGGEYERVLQQAFSTDGFDRLEPSSRQDIANKLFVAAKQVAKAKLLAEIEANSKKP